MQNTIAASLPAAGAVVMGRLSRARPAGRRTSATAFGLPRHSFQHRFVYAVISPRAGGLSIGVNMNPDKQCNFDCVYCEVNRAMPATEHSVDVEVMNAELREMLAWAREGRFARMPAFCGVPAELLRLREVALSGDGEPTLCPNFREVVEAVVHLRALAAMPFFKVVLITNATGLDLTEVRAGLDYFTERDEIWAKLDAGTQGYMDIINRGSMSLEKVLHNILTLARERPVVIQSLFCKHRGFGPPEAEIAAYVHRLNELKASGAHISLVQIYSAHRPVANPGCEHLALPALSAIARHVRAETGLKVAVF